MSDYISREKVLEEEATLKGYSSLRFVLVDDIKSIPCADVRENIHGEWENCNEDNPDNMIFRCSVCGYEGMTEYYNFCPNCGCQMNKDGKLPESGIVQI